MTEPAPDTAHRGDSRGLPGDGQRPMRNLLLPCYVAAVVVAALGCLVIAALTTSRSPWWGERPTLSVMLAVVLLAGELRPIKWMRRHNGGEATATWLVSIALMMTVPVLTSLLAAAGASALAETVRRKPPVRVMFNAAQIVVSLALGAGLLGLTGQRQVLANGQHIQLVWLPAMLAAATLIFLCNSLLSATAIALSLRVPVRTLLSQSLTLNLINDGSLLVLAPVLVVVAQRSLLLLPLLLITALTVHVSASLALEREHAATHDALTGIANRSLFLEHARSALVAADRGHYRMGVVIFDLDDFKAVNDKLGHHIGDVILRTTADRLQDAVRGNDIVARLGGDEFALLLGSIDDEQAATAIVERLHAVVSSPVILEEFRVPVGGSFGIALFPDHGSDVEALLTRADAAMYRAKNEGGGVRMHDVRGGHRHGPLSLLRDVSRAFDRDEFVLHYQPLLSLREDRISSVEALVRWNHPTYGLVPPSDFVPLIEESEFLPTFTRWVIAQAVHQAGAWHRGGIDIDVAVNGSAGTLQDRELPGYVSRVLRREGLLPGGLVLELTEHTLLETGSVAEQVLAELRALGIGISVDDFGTGYSSLTHLRRLPADTLKIDRSFVSNMADSPKDTAIVRSVINLAQTLGLRTVAEGVEDDAALAKLRQLGCDYAQGFLISRPAPPHELAGVLPLPAAC